MVKEADRYNLELSLNLSAKQLLTRLVMPGGLLLILRVIIYLLEKMSELIEEGEAKK